MCDSAAAQDFLLRNAREHASSYVRHVCIAHLNAPFTGEKTDLLINRLETGTQNEQFIAAMKVKEFRVARAAPALRALRAATADMVLSRVLDEALSVLRAGGPEPLFPAPAPARLLRNGPPRGDLAPKK